MGEEGLEKGHPLEGTVDDPGADDPYAHLRDKEKEQGGPPSEGAGEDETTEQPTADGTGGDQAGL